MDLIFDKREKYKREIKLLEKIYADWDIKTKCKKIHENVRKIYPVLEFEGEIIENFNKILEKIKNAESGKILTNIGYAFIFFVGDAYVKKGFLNETYAPAVISPFPNNLRYEVVKINKNLNVKSGDYIFIKKGFVKYYSLSPSNIRYFKRVLYIEEADNIDKVLAYKISRNLSDEFKNKIYAMLSHLAEEKESEKIAASLLSANAGMGLFSIVNNKYTKKEISEIYYSLRNSLPEIFRNEEISLNFESGYFKKSSIKITIKGVPLFETINFEECPQQSLWFENACNNQTIASPIIAGKIEDPLFLYRNVNLINICGFSQHSFLETPDVEDPIYDEEIQFWLISQRNLYSYAFDNIYVNKFFKKIFANVIQENLNLFLPENLLNLAVESTVIKESLRRGFEGFCRKGDEDTVENAEKFIRECLTEMSKFSFERGKYFRIKLEKNRKKSGERKQICNLLDAMLKITGRVNYDELITAIKKDTKSDEQVIKDTVDFINKEPGSIKIKFMNNVKIVEFR